MRNLDTIPLLVHMLTFAFLVGVSVTRNMVPHDKTAPVDLGEKVEKLYTYTLLVFAGMSEMQILHFIFG